MLQSSSRGGLPGPGGVLPAGRGGSPCRGGLPSPGGGCLPGPGGSAWSGGFSLPGGGVCLVQGGSPCRGDLPGPGGGSPCWGGVCLVRGACPETPPVDRITDTCKNITLATTSLQPVIILGFRLNCSWMEKSVKIHCQRSSGKTCKSLV